MNRNSMLMIGITAVWLAVVGGLAISAQDKYTVKVPGGLAFADFRGYEGWQAISLSRSDKVVAMILDEGHSPFILFLRSIWILI